MFKFFERVLHQKKLKNIPAPKKLRVIKNCVENVIQDSNNINIPAFQRVNLVVDYIQVNRLCDFYFENRRLIPVLCQELKCL